MLVRNVFGSDWYLDASSVPGSGRDADAVSQMARILALRALAEDPAGAAVARLHRQATGRLHGWQDASQARDWLERSIANGQIAIQRRTPALGVLDHPRELYPEPVLIGHEVARKPANPRTGAPEQLIPVAVFAGTGAAAKAGLPNDTDGSCPSDNHRSESTSTCSPQVTAWFDRKGVAQGYRDGTLGHHGGGGFERGKTAVRNLFAGTKLYRYVDSATWPYGAWWFLQPLDGDPRVLAALPTDSSASVMVQSRLKRDVDVLYGPGAPRCSNKPGGPEQVFVARCDYLPEEGDILDIVG